MATRKTHSKKSIKQKRRQLLTTKEKSLLDEIAKCDRATTAASHLGISPRTAYNMLYRLRLKYVMARSFVNNILVYRRKSNVLERVLSRRLSLEEEEIKEIIREEEE